MGHIHNWVVTDGRALFKGVLRVQTPSELFFDMSFSQCFPRISSVVVQCEFVYANVWQLSDEKSSQKMVVIRRLISCFKFAKNRLSARLCLDPLGGSLQCSHRPHSWIMGKGGEREIEWQEGEGKEEEGAGRKRKEGGGKGILSTWESWLCPCRWVI